MAIRRSTEAGLFAIVVVAWGLNYLFVREGLTLVAPLWLAFLRAFVGCLGVGAYLLVRPELSPLDRAGKRDAILLGVLNTGLFFGLWFQAAGEIAPGVTAVIVYTFPLWVALMTVGLDRTGPSPAVWAALLAGFSGVVLVAQPWRSGGGSLPLGSVVELLLGSVCWAAGTVLLRRRFSAAELPRANGWQMAGGAGTLLLLALIVEPTGTGTTLGFPLLAVVLWLGLVGSALAYTIWFFLLGTRDAPRLSALTFLVPVVALLASVLLLGETISASQGAGIALVLLSVYVVAMGPRGTDRARDRAAPTEDLRPGATDPSR